MCILRCLSLKKKEEKKRRGICETSSLCSSSEGYTASPPRGTWKISARQREAMGDVDPRGSRRVNPRLQHWDTAPSKHEHRREGGRGEGVKYFQPFSLVCIPWRLLQLRAGSERTADRLHPHSSPSSTPAPPSLRKRTCYPQEGISGCVAWGSATGIYTMQDPACICIICQFIHCSEFVSLQVLSLFFFFLTDTVCACVCRCDLKISARALCHAVSLATYPEGLDSICPPTELIPPK